jgi:hypothetical protein
MAIFSKYENPELESKKVFVLWLQLGSLVKVGSHLQKQGVFSEKTQTQYGSVTLSRCAWKYVLDNPEEAYQEVLKSGSNVSPEYWEQLIVRRAYAIYVSVGKNRQKFYDWLEKNNLEKYKDYRSQKRFFSEEGDLQTIQE